MKTKQISQTTGKSRKNNYPYIHSAHDQVLLLLQEIKEKNGEVIQIPITPRTTIELPATLSEAEINARIDNYKKLHESKI